MSAILFGLFAIALLLIGALLGVTLDRAWRRRDRSTRRGGPEIDLLWRTRARDRVALDAACGTSRYWTGAD